MYHIIPDSIEHRQTENAINGILVNGILSRGHIMYCLEVSLHSEFRVWYASRYGNTCTLTIAGFDRQIRMFGNCHLNNIFIMFRYFM